MTTLTYQQGGTYTGTIDVAVRQAAPNSAPSEGLGLFVNGTSGAQMQVLLAFTGLFGSGPGQIPIGATITSATITVRVTDATTTGLSISRLLMDWPEQSSWNSLGNGVQLNGIEAMSSPDLVLGSVSTGFQVFDVTASLVAWLAGATTAAQANAANDGWVFTGLGTDGFTFRSSESGAPPVLTVTFTVGGEQPPPPPPPTGDVIGVKVYDGSDLGPGYGSTDPTDVVYDPSTGTFYVSDSEVDESPFNAQNNLFRLDGDGDALRAYSMRSFTSEPTGLAIWQNRMYISDDNKKMIYVVDKDNPTVLLPGLSFSTTLFNIADPEDLSINPKNGNLFILNERTKTIYEIEFTASGPRVVDQIVLPSPFTTKSNGAEGLVYDAEYDQFYVCAGRSSYIYVVSRDGEITDTITILSQYKNDGGYRVFPKGLELAPSGDGSGKLSLWVTDYGKDQVADGRLFEIMLDRPAPSAMTSAITFADSDLKESEMVATVPAENWPVVDLDAKPQFAAFGDLAAWHHHDFSGDLLA